MIKYIQTSNETNWFSIKILAKLLNVTQSGGAESTLLSITPPQKAKAI